MADAVVIGSVKICSHFEKGRLLVIITLRRSYRSALLRAERSDGPLPPVPGDEQQTEAFMRWTGHPATTASTPATTEAPSEP